MIVNRPILGVGPHRRRHFAGAAPAPTPIGPTSLPRRLDMGLFEAGIARAGIVVVQALAEIKTREEREEADQQDISDAAHGPFVFTGYEAIYP